MIVRRSHRQWKEKKGKQLTPCLLAYNFPSSDVNAQFPNEELTEIAYKTWEMSLDGASNKKGHGIEILLVSPDGAHTPIAMKVNFEATKKIAEYEACITGFEAAV